MKYKELLLDLIRDKKEVSEDDKISLSLGEIAAAWHRNVLYKNTLLSSDREQIDPGFLDDIILTIKKLENEGLVEFRSIRGGPFSYLGLSEDPKEWKRPSVSDIAQLRSLQDKICLEVKKTVYQVRPSGTELKFDYIDVSLYIKNKFYKPQGEIRKKLVKELWLKKQTQNKEEKIIKKGERMKESQLAVISGIIRSEQEFEFKETKKKFKEMKKQLNKIFQEKKFPINIHSNREGILLIETVE